MEVYHIGIISFENENTKREPKAIGGIQGYIVELVNYLLSNNIPVGFIGKIYNFDQKDNFIYHEIQNEYSSTNKFLINLFKQSFSIKLSKKSILHAHRSDHLAAFAFNKNNPSVISLHGQQRKTVNDRKGIIVRTIYNSLERFALKKANAIIPVDNITKNYYLNIYPQYKDKMHVIPTGVNTNDFKPLDKNILRKKFGFSTTDKIILYVGRIEPPKKIEEIVKSFEILSKLDNSYKLVFVGDGVLMDEIKNLVKRLSLDEIVTFMGVRKRNELPELFNLADVSVLYSNNEGSPLSVKESLACGVPVVANCVGDIPSVIKNDFNGYLVENENNNQLAEKLKIAIGNSKSLKQNCVDSIQQFTTAKVNQMVLDLYKKILNEK